MNIGKDSSWVEVYCPIPFRKRYLYWDKEPFVSDNEFKEKNIKVRHIKGEFRSSKYPYVGIIISCWSKDKTRVEEVMDNVDRKLKIIDKKYEEFLNLWHQNVIELIKKKNF